jgi:hypothetical protein
VIFQINEKNITKLYYAKSLKTKVNFLEK